MLALNRSLLNREYSLINVLKALASIISMCNLHGNLVSKTMCTPRYFTVFTNGIFLSPIQCKMRHRRTTTARAETALEFSNNKTLLALSRLQKGVFCKVTFCSNQSQSYVTTDGQPTSLSWNKAPIWGLRPDLDYCLTVAGLLIWSALSDERTGLVFSIATGPRQRSHFRVRDSWPYFTFSDLRLPFSSPATTRRVTVEVFDPASTRVTFCSIWISCYIASGRTIIKHVRCLPMDVLYCWLRVLLQAFYRVVA
jgi:hypothetical protein